MENSKRAKHIKHHYNYENKKVRFRNFYALTTKYKFDAKMAWALLAGKKINGIDLMDIIK
jgi:hypothetical protein